ncbi:flagellar basal body rod protein FlgB [Candidatus Desantisbacteria bacterium]|nr:flagellar basal body rod protein FlgB [Candidatus Desantisbacteria bacterium]
MEIFDGNVPLLTKAIKHTTLRHEILANNVANIETPDFKSKDVVFKKELNSSMEKILSNDPLSENPKYISKAFIVENENNKFKEFNSKMDIDVEMSKISKNTILNHTLVQLLNQKFRIIKSFLNIS